jgi:hypothetical protein
VQELVSNNNNNNNNNNCGGGGGGVLGDVINRIYQGVLYFLNIMLFQFLLGLSEKLQHPLCRFSQKS